MADPARHAALAIAGTVVAALAAATPAPAASLLELNFWMSGPRYDAAVPACDDPSAVATIADRFGTKEARFWNSNLQIVEIGRIREVAMRPWDPNTIPRRYCTGEALVSDGRKRRVDYSIIENSGALGVSWGVEWCVAGLDRNWAYSPNCRMARP